MTTQATYTLIFSILLAILVILAIKAYKSDKPVGRFTCLCEVSLISLLICNIIIVNAQNETLALFGYYLFYIGMTLTMMSLVSFTNIYCRDVDSNNKHRKPIFIYCIGLIDVIQLLCAPLFNHVASVESIKLDDQIFYMDLPKIGLTIHRIIDYFTFIYILIIFIFSLVKISKLYREKYLSIVIILIIDGIAQLFFIFSQTPIDRSILVHAGTGILLYYYSIKYRPLRLLDAILSNIASDMNDAVFVFDSLNKCIWANEKCYNLLNIPTGKVGLVKSSILETFGDLTNRGDNWVDNIHLTQPDRYYTIEKKSIKSNNLLDGSFVIIKDNTEQYNATKKEIYESTHDPLTGLFNMQYLYSRIKELLKTSKKEYYIVYINIKNFKLVNDIFGWKFGDKVLSKFAKWLKSNIKGTSTYGRLIGDTFGILIPVESFNENVFIKGLSDFKVKEKNIEHKIIAHIGVYKIKDKSIEVSIMFDRAHLAITGIGDDYKTVVKYYDDNLRNTLLEEQQLAANLDEAIKTKQIRPYLQPILDSNGKVIGAEALARWIHPELGFLPPYKFIPAFERNGMIVDVDRHIWRCACEILKNWKDKFNDLFISINISPKDFYFINILNEIMSLVKEYNIEPIKLRIEITETVIMSDPEEKLKIFNELRQNGFIVEMDDFGSGYSSLNMLKNIPIDVLKLDMKFLSNEQESNDKSNIIIKNIINLSNELNLTALTEGVETVQQYDQLVEMGCNLFQGYYFAKPMPVDEFEQFAENNLKEKKS